MVHSVRDCPKLVGLDRVGLNAMGWGTREINHELIQRLTEVEKWCAVCGVVCGVRLL